MLKLFHSSLLNGYKYNRHVNIVKCFDFLFTKHLYHLPVKPKSFQQNHKQKMTSSMIKNYNLILKIPFNQTDFKTQSV